MVDEQEEAVRRRERRRVVVAGASSLAFAVGLLVPTARVATTTARRPPSWRGRWLRVARLDELRAGAPVRVTVVADLSDGPTLAPATPLGAVWLVRDREEVRALSASCPHLGCAVERSEGGFGCPCHGSRFDAEGQRLAGPAPRDLDPIDSRVLGDEERTVEVRFRRYRHGVPEREPLP